MTAQTKHIRPPVGESHEPPARQNPSCTHQGSVVDVVIVAADRGRHYTIYRDCSERSPVLGSREEAAAAFWAGMTQTRTDGLDFERKRERGRLEGEQEQGKLRGRGRAIEVGESPLAANPLLDAAAVEPEFWPSSRSQPSCESTRTTGRDGGDETIANKAEQAVSKERSAVNTPTTERVPSVGAGTVEAHCSHEDVVLTRVEGVEVVLFSCAACGQRKILTVPGRPLGTLALFGEEE